MAKAKWNVFGGTHSTAAAAAAIPTATTIPATTKPSSAVPSADAKKFGLENFGNTCYANSVIQALYFCTPFRDLVLQSPDHSPPTLAAVHPTRKQEPKTPTSHDAPPAPPLSTIPSSPPTLFSALRSLFLYISSHPAEKGTVAPRAFIDKLREVTDLFRSTMHQDAHEFLNYLLNKIVEEVEEERKHLQNATPPEDMSNSITTLPSQPPTIITATTSSNSGTSPQDATLVHRLFEGVLTSETRCLTCETVSSRDESFLDLSIDIEQNSSVTACLRQFSASEMLCQRNKFFCDSCCDLQEAEKRMKIKKLPNVLALHLKRFKYQEDVQRYIKLAYRVAFPFELRLFNTVDDMDDADRLYNLFGIVVHIGNGPHHGHYVSIIKTLGTWLVFDDDNVYPISENDIPKYFGDSNSGSAYVLYYQAADIDLAGLGLHILPTQPAFSAAVAHVDPSIPESPAPAMPPGLVHHEEGDISDLSDPPFPVTPSPAMPAPLHMSPKREKATNFQSEGTATSAAGSDLGELSSINTQVVGLGISGSETGNSSPVIPPKIGKTPRLFAGMRRTPSLNARTSVEATAGAVGVDSRKSLAERTPRSIASSPALSSGHADGVEDSQPPPVPSVPHIHGDRNGKEKELEKGDKEKGKGKDKAKKEKDPEKKSNTWFGKRKSVKDKSRAENSLSDLSSSPQMPSSLHSRAATAGDETQSSSSSPHWHKTSRTSTEKSRQPSEPGPTPGHSSSALHPTIRPKPSIGALLGISNRRSNGYETPSAGSATSSMASISHREPTPPAPLPPPSLPHASASTPVSPVVHEFPPPRKSSLGTSKAFQQISQSPIFAHHKKSLSGLRDELTPPRPATAGAHSEISESLRPLPPVPPIPQNLRRASHDVQRGKGYQAASPIIANGITNGVAHRHDPELDAMPEMRANQLAASTDSPGLASFSGSANHSAASSNTTASSGVKRAGRKLSLSTPMKLGFGRKDKEKEREKEKEGHEREKHKAPSAFAHSISRF